MNSVRYVCLMPLLTLLLLVQGSSQSSASSTSNQPTAVVSGLYRQVVTRHPLGVPSGANMKAFSPYLSKALRHRFELHNACFVDWRKQNPDPSLKPPVGMIENGVFSGANEEAEPRAFHIEKTEFDKDGTTRVYVRLTVGVPKNKPQVWHVAAVVVREDDSFVVDDVLYLMGESSEVESRLSNDLSAECDGDRWVGISGHPDGPVSKTISR